MHIPIAKPLKSNAFQKNVLQKVGNSYTADKNIPHLLPTTDTATATGLTIENGIFENSSAEGFTEDLRASLKKINSFILISTISKMQKPSKHLLLISFGLFVLAISQITWHFLDLPDFFNGALAGLGIGLMLIALLNKKIQKRHF